MNNTLKIRPEARLIRTIGSDLIKDYYAAIIELVKNAYDADSEDVIITLSYEKAKIYEKEEYFLKFTIEDDAIGMSLATIEKAWMVPATSFKLDEKTSNGGRYLQGRKGIGRYAAAILGDYLRIETTTENGETTLIEIDWRKFDTNQNNLKYLDEITIPYQNEITNLNKGTRIEIYSNVFIDKENNIHINWSQDNKKDLLKELRNLIVPIDKNKDDKFNIKLIYKGLSEFGFENSEDDIEPFPLLELYDYRISGIVNKNGKAILKYENQNYLDSNEIVNFNFGKNTNCGNIDIDLRFFDLDPQGIDELISRGLKDPTTKEYLGKREAQNLVKEYAGIGIYRNLFGIRPYNDKGYDWLELNQRRIFNPTIRVSTNQVIGFINIESEEKSNLIEKSNREGLKENISYVNLQEILKSVIKEVEARRYVFRKNTKRGRKPSTNIKESIKNLFNFDNVSYKLRNLLEKSGLDEKIIINVEQELKNEEKEKEKDYKRIQDTLVMYEAHAALGRLVQLVIHEGRKPLQFIGSNLDNLKSDIEYFIKHTGDIRTQMEILNFVDTNKEHLKTISKLFASLDPLTAKKLSKKREFNICQNIIDNCSFFKNQFEENNIIINITCNKDLFFYGRVEDFFIIYTNLIENSIYWLKEKPSQKKEIQINVKENENEIIINFIDTGKGVEEKFANEIFDAGFSMKPEGGTGIGLTLVGQAISRNNGQIECIKNHNGAHFRITLKKDKKDGN